MPEIARHVGVVSGASVALPAVCGEGGNPAKLAVLLNTLKCMMHTWRAHRRTPGTPGVKGREDGDEGWTWRAALPTVGRKRRGG